MVEGIWVTLQRHAQLAGGFSRSQLLRQADRARSACFAAMSRNVCGSAALTAIDGFSVGNAMPNTAILPTFSNVKYALLSSLPSRMVCSYTSASVRGVGSRVVVIGMPGADGSKNV